MAWKPKRDRVATVVRASSYRRGYTKQWQRARLHHLACNANCVECEKIGITKPATDVDHIIPHRLDDRLFWDRTNWQSLCSDCHKKKTASGL